MYLKQESELEGPAFFTPQQLHPAPTAREPFLPLTMPSGSLSFASEIDDDENARGCAAAEKMVTDWRALDKPVASQLSQEDDFLGSRRSVVSMQKRVRRWHCYSLRMATRKTAD
ncbi:hypothetical protein HPP92_007109 [Vanilla planifolia]|uniref:Uncharacterized protein n=1 Tax=Vanilla planifolia TaxID=51239 RepID=A0A835RJT4_VANPL|nr:hypothetical protein HPP92_007109 [Vanilla planifolia]